MNSNGGDHEEVGDRFVQGSAVEDEVGVLKKRDGGSGEVTEHDDCVLDLEFSAT